MERDFEWIHEGMSLDNNSSDSKYRVRVFNTGNLGADFYAYANCFFDSAQYVMDVLEKQSSESIVSRYLDIWCYSVIYLYRHSLELLIKACIFRKKVSDSEKAEIVKNIGHDLEKGFDEILTLYDIDISSNHNAKWIQKYLADVLRVDNGSDMFRYPFGLDNNVLFHEGTFLALDMMADNVEDVFSEIKKIYEDGTLSSSNRYMDRPPKFIIESENDDFGLNSYVGYFAERRGFYPYIQSYVEVGTLLRDKLLEEEKDNYFIPMCYMYRNAVELGIKRIIVEDIADENDRILKKLQRKKHSILSLWQTVQMMIIKEQLSENDRATIRQVDCFIRYLHQMDSSTSKFRYPCDKNMNVYFLKPKAFDVDNDSSCFMGLCNFFDALDSRFTENYEFFEDKTDYMMHQCKSRFN